MDSFKLRLSFILFFLTQLAFCQLSNFTLTVTKTDETCTANGTLTFSTSNTASGATIIYAVYLLPNTTTPIAVQAATTLSGLVAGNYRVIATQSLGSSSGTQQQDITIQNSLHPLTFQISGNDELCGNDGTITVNVLTGIFFNCEIFAGPMTRPLQTSNTFTGLVAGQYSIRVFDSCHDGVAQTYTIAHKTPGLIITTVFTGAPTNCNTASVSQILSHSASTVIAYPLTVQYTVYPPLGGTPIVFNQTVLYSPFYDFPSVSQDFPLFPNQSYTYDFKVTDACGNVYTSNGNLVSSSTMPTINEAFGNCSTSLSIYNALIATMISAPSTYTHSLPYNLPNVSFSNLIFLANDLTPGNYSFNVIDVCGISYVLNYLVNNHVPFSPTIGVSGGCQVGVRTVTISSAVDLGSVIITSAPASFQQTLPYDISFGIAVESNGLFISGELPEGDYVFKVITECGDLFNFTIHVDGYYMINNIDVIENCGSFDISLFHTSNNGNSIPFFWLQKFDPFLNQWVHPVTGAISPFDNNAHPDAYNSISLNNNLVNYNFTASGHFRIIKSAYEYQVGTINSSICINVLKEFDYYAQPRINKVYTFGCSNGKYDAIVDASGIGNLIYSITLKNNLPFLVENGTNSVFLQLDSDIYNFQVEDICGNISNVALSIPTQFGLEIMAANLCQGEAGVLSTPFFPFLSYSWWKDSDVGTILSTTNVLNIPSYNTTTDSGIYHVRITFNGNPTSCINSILDFNTASLNAIPNAGNGTSVSYCGRQGRIDLFSFLTGSFDLFGTWSETTSLGILTDNFWNTSAVAFGAYQFRYRVSGTCGQFAEAYVNITINAIPDIPLASVDPIVCESQNVNLFATTVGDASYHWVGPDGFVSTIQNPILDSISSNDNGTYTVYATENNCQSGNSSVSVLVNPLPSFALNQDCVGKDYQVWYTKLNEISFDEATATFSWTGPSNFTSNQTPITITGGELGIYSLKIINQYGCEVTNSINVTRNICFIPNVITPNNDVINENLDLTGFGVDKLEIYNRWGRKVYEKSNYSDEWHGQNMYGSILPDSTYFYIIILSNGETKNGWIFLTRG